MTRSILSAILIAVATWQACTPLLQAANPRPNILFLFTDDQPQNCLGIMGNDHIKTPHLDALARRGTLFNNAFVTTAICCSSRASILTGQHLYRHGIDDFKKPLSAAAFAMTYPALLRQSGYRAPAILGNTRSATRPEPSVSSASRPGSLTIGMDSRRASVSVRRSMVRLATSPSS